MEVDRNGLRILTPGECIDLLGTGRIGRIALSKRALPTIKPVLYTLDGAVITFYSSGGLLIAAAERGDIVCFEADFANAGESELWSVVVVGRLELQRPVSGAPEIADIVSSRFGADKISLPITNISGRAQTIDLEPVAH